MSAHHVLAVRRWLVLTVVLAAAVFLFWPRAATDCTLYGAAGAVDQSMFTAMADHGVACLR